MAGVGQDKTYSILLNNSILGKCHFDSVFEVSTVVSPLFCINEATEDALLIDESTQLRTDLHQRRTH